MYTVILASVLGLVVAIGGVLLDFWGWFGGSALGLLTFVISFILIMRRVAKQLRPAMERVKKQAESGLFPAAIDTLTDLLPLGKWVPMLRGQLIGQIGAFAHYGRDKDKALEYLTAAPNRAGEAKMLLACLKYKDNEADQAIEVLEKAAPFQRKSAMFHNLLAWMLHKQKRTEDAMARLAAYLKKDENNEVTKDNLLRLQNGKKLSMKGFGMQWYALQLERPPASLVQQMQSGPGAHQQHIGRKHARRNR